MPTIFHEKAGGWASEEEELGVSQPPCRCGGSPPRKQTQIQPRGSPSLSCTPRRRSWGSGGQCLVSGHSLLM